MWEGRPYGFKAEKSEGSGESAGREEHLEPDGGDMENRIKEQQLYMFADRTSTGKIRSNQTRLYFSSLAYVLVNALRRFGLKNTRLAKAQCHTIRLKLFKIGAQIRVTVRKIWVSFAEGYPYKDVFLRAFANVTKT